MSNDFRPMDGELFEAMLAGKVLEGNGNNTATYEPKRCIDGIPFIFTDSDGERELLKWSPYDKWRIREEPKMRRMTEMEILGKATREGFIWRQSSNRLWNAGFCDFFAQDLHDLLPKAEWAIIDGDGNFLEGPSRFEVPEE